MSRHRGLLPGTTDENHKGLLNQARETEFLTRVYRYEGPAWYQRRIEIPESWRGKRVQFFRERTKWSRARIDDRGFGPQDSLAAPHLYLLGSLTPGPHTLTVMVDNSKYVRMGDVHQIGDGTQTNWKRTTSVQNCRVLQYYTRIFIRMRADYEDNCTALHRLQRGIAPGAGEPPLPIGRIYWEVLVSTLKIERPKSGPRQNGKTAAK